MIPMGTRPGVFARAHSSAKTYRCSSDQPVPPYSAGQSGAPQPCRCRVFCHSIAELISDEHPQIIALVVASLEPSLAADVLILLPKDMQSDIVERIATLTTVQPEALRDLERVIQRKFKDSTTLRASQIGGVKAAANIMNFTKQDMEQRILTAFVDALDATEDPAARDVLERLCSLYALKSIHDDRAWFMEHNRISSGRSKALEG